MSDFMTRLLDLVFFIFDKTNSYIIVIPFVVVFFCLCLSLVGRLMRRF